MINCEGCGVCCMTIRMPPFDWTREDRANVPADLLRGLDLFRSSPRLKKSNACPWFDLLTGKCQHYDHRPLACREFVPGADACMKIRKDFDVSG